MSVWHWSRNEYQSDLQYTWEKTPLLPCGWLERSLETQIDTVREQHWPRACTFTESPPASLSVREKAVCAPRVSSIYRCSSAYVQWVGLPPPDPDALSSCKRCCSFSSASGVLASPLSCMSSFTSAEEESSTRKVGPSSKHLLHTPTEEESGLRSLVKSSRKKGHVIHQAL